MTFDELGIVVPSGAGGNVYATCPSCSKDRRKKKAKCLSVDVDKGLFNCHHCGWSGSLTEGGKRTDTEHWQRPAYRPIERIVADTVSGAAMEWFSARGITAKTLHRAKVVTTTAYMPQVEEHVECVVFPYFVPTDDRMEVVNRKYRQVGEKHFRLEPGARIAWYGLDRLAGAETVVVVEGEMDALAIMEAGHFAVLSVPHGAPTPESKDYSRKFDFIAECEKLTAHVKHWVIWSDDDAPGKALESELARRLGVEVCSRVLPVSGCKDANDVLAQFGPEAVMAALDQAQPWPLEGVYRIGEMADRISALYDHGLPKGAPTGWSAMDAVWSVKPGEVTVVTGIPNSGKSNWVDALCVNASKANGWHVILCSPENQPIEDHMARICEKWSGKPFDDGPMPRMTGDELTAAEREVHNRFAWLLPDTLALPEILEKSAALVRKNGSRILVLDPWNEMDHNVGEREDQYLAAQLKNIKQWARKHDCHVIIVAHPKTMSKDKSGNYGIPTPYDISGGAMWRNKMDNCITVWRDFGRDDGVIEVHVTKVRFRQVGRIGIADLKYHKATATYTSIEERRHKPVAVPKREPEDHWQDGTA